jgi:hypothetical protein
MKRNLKQPNIVPVEKEKKKVKETSKVSKVVTPAKLTFSIPVFKPSMPSKSMLKTVGLTLIAGLLIGYLLTNFGIIPNFNNISKEMAKSKTEAYLATLPLQSYEVKSVMDDKDVYKIELTVNGQPYTSYISKDGRTLYQGGIDLNAPVDGTATADTGGTPQAPVDLPKSDKPNVELFVMSHCPYGTQIEKGILPVVEALGNKIDFEIKFVDYAMHGEKEVLEQLNQYCIEKMNKATYLTYLKCFLDAGDGATCLNTAGIDQTALKDCTAKADAEFKISANFKDKTTWKGSYPVFNTHKDDNTKYGVAGSPTLIINGAEAQAGRDSASLLSTICAAFNTAPAECDIQLESASPTPGFGYNTTTTDSAAAQCN